MRDIKDVDDFSGYYRVHLEHEGFKTPFIVYARSNDQAIAKALDDASEELPGARVHDIEGPYHNALGLR